MNQVAALTYLFSASRPLATALLMAFSLPALSMETTVVTSLLPPFTSPDTPERPGFYVEVAKAAFERAGLSFSIEFQPWARAQANTLATPGLFILGLAHTPEGIFLAAAKETPDETIKKLHDAVQALHADGTYDRIYGKYFGR